jgi:hypothetical protein
LLRGEPPGLDREVEDQHERDDERRYCDRTERDRVRDLVEPRSRLVGREDPERDREREGQELGVEDELERDAQLLADGVLHGEVRRVVASEVSLDEVQEPVLVLDEERLVEPDLFADGLELFLGRERLLGAGRVTRRQVEQGEREERDD